MMMIYNKNNNNNNNNNYYLYDNNNDDAFFTWWVPRSRQQIVAGSYKLLKVKEFAFRCNTFGVSASGYLHIDNMEDLQNNKFFAAMRHIFPNLEEEACSRQWTLLIPQSTAIQVSKFTTKSILFSHIVQPLNQYYPGHFLTLNGKSIKYEPKERSLKACSKISEAGGAFAEERTVNILFEETFFVGDESFKVFCINRPITGPGDVLRTTYDGLELFSPKRSAKCWVEMLRRSKVDRPAVTLALKEALELNQKLMNGFNAVDASNQENEQENPVLISKHVDVGS